MVKIAPARPSFASGRLSPRLFGRIDIDQYQSGSEEITNFVVFPHGGAIFRSGSYFVQEVKDSADYVRLLPFVFNNDQAYVLEAGPEYIRVYDNHAPTLDGFSNQIELTTPYTSDQLDTLYYTQSGDIMFVVTRDVRPKEVRRLSATSWDFVNFEFRDGPFQDVNDTDTELSLSGVGGSNITITATSTEGINDGDGFQSTDVGRQIRYEDSNGDWFWYIITAVNSTTEVVADRGSGQDNPSSGGGTTTWRLGAWSDTTGWPEVVAFHQQRLFFARGQRVWGSRTGDFNNFGPTDKDGTVNDDNAVTYRLASGKIDQIQWMQGARTLEVGTAGAEFTISGGANVSVDSPLTPDSVLARKSTELGAYKVSTPIYTDNGTVFINRAGRKLINYYYSFQIDNYTGDDLTLLAEDIAYPGVFEVTYQGEPDMVIWAVRADGTLLGCTFNPKQDVVAWHEHVLGGEYDGGTPVVESITVVPNPDGTADELWLSVLRTVGGVEKRYIEFFEPLFGPLDAVEEAYFVDCGLSYDGSPETVFDGLDHLEGETLSVVADGELRPEVTVSGGEIELDLPASVVHVGYGYTGRLKLLPMEPGNLQDPLTGKRYKYNEVGILFDRTLQAEVGVDGYPLELVTLRETSDFLGEAVDPRSDYYEIPVEASSEFRPNIVVEQNVALPCTVLAVYPKIEFES